MVVDCRSNNSQWSNVSSGGGLGGCAGSIGRASTTGTANTGTVAMEDLEIITHHNGKAGGSGIVIIRYQV